MAEAANSTRSTAYPRQVNQWALTDVLGDERREDGPVLGDYTAVTELIRTASPPTRRTRRVLR
jgi:hypothetical protein